MKNILKKRIITFLCVAIVFCGAADICSADSVGSLTNEPSDWASAEVMSAAASGIIDLSADYDYKSGISRLQFCEIVNNMIDLKNGININTNDITKNLEQEKKADSEQEIDSDESNPGMEIPTGTEDDESDIAETSVTNAGISTDGAVTVDSTEPETSTEPAVSTVEQPDPSPFSDVDNTAVTKLSKLGIVSGYKGLFNPDGYITREQAASILMRTAGYFGFKNPNGQVPVYYDGHLFSQWASESIKFISSQQDLNGQRVMNGYKSKFDPQGQYTVEQAILSVNRLYNSMTSEPASDTSWKAKTGWRLSKMTLSAAGDCTLGRDLSAAYQTSLDAVYDSSGGNPLLFFANVSQFKDDDITIVNFEGTLTDATKAATKTFRFKGRKEYTSILKSGSIEVVNIANNHTFDYLEKGYKDTVNHLKEADIGVAGRDYVYIKDVKGLKVGFLGLDPMSRGLDQDIKNSINRCISALKEQGAQYIVASFHWGIEREYSHNANQSNIAHYTIDSGADLVLGHHPHVLQGTEIYNGAQIVYSLGNFCFGGNKNPSDKDTAVFQETVTFDCETGNIIMRDRKMFPYRLSSVTYRNDYQPVPVSGADADRVNRKIGV